MKTYFILTVLASLLLAGIILFGAEIIQVLGYAAATLFFGNANFLSDRGEFRGLPAWHKAGNVFDYTDDVSLIDAARKHWHDIKIRKLKVFSPWAEPNPETGSIDISPIEVPGEFNIFREPIPEDPEPMFLGRVTKRWVTKDPMWYADKLNDLSKEFPLETLGVLGKGERVFFSLRDEPIKVTNGVYTEDLHSHYVFDLSFKVGEASKAFTTRTRPVCSNTLHIGWNNAKHKIAIPHTMKPDEVFEWLVIVSEFAKKEAEYSSEVMSNFMRVPLRVDSEEFERLINGIYKTPAVPGRVQRYLQMSAEQKLALTGRTKKLIERDERRLETGTERADELRKNVKELAEKFNDEFPQVANTAYMAYNAVTELATWRKPSDSREDVARSVLAGARAEEINKGFDDIEKYVIQYSN